MPPESTRGAGAVFASWSWLAGAARERGAASNKRTNAGATNERRPLRQAAPSTFNKLQHSLWPAIWRLPPVSISLGDIYAVCNSALTIIYPSVRLRIDCQAPIPTVSIYMIFDRPFRGRCRKIIQYLIGKSPCNQLDGGDTARDTYRSSAILAACLSQALAGHDRQTARRVVPIVPNCALGAH